MAWLKSGRLHYAAGVTALFFLIFVVLRAVFYFGFSEVGKTLHPDPGTLYETLYIGIKFDLRLALILSLPVFLLTWLPRYNVLRSSCSAQAGAYLYCCRAVSDAADVYH